ncbi:hypothetical protein BJ122_102114 [Rhodopseudomonas faecalis]|uniref:Uncharacterized protein n=2 Tax=Rhodopseudomonas faecalis TaxID=99655 RepID=A0A318TZ29_9BRAD|nr:hypothetical protein BJ122_102114 [Rhodopseudomonas faecalis]
MMATNKKVREQEPGAIEALLPWHATGKLSAQDQRRVEDAIQRDPEIARQFAIVQEECAATIQVSESLGAPSPHALEQLFLAIDAEPQRRGSHGGSWFSGMLAALSPRTVAFTAVAALALLLVQGGVIAALLLQDDQGRVPVQTAERSAPNAVAPSAPPPPPAMAAPSAPQPAPMMAADSKMQRMAEAPMRAESAPITRSVGPAPMPQALLRFAPQAPIAEVVALLDRYQAAVLENGKGGLFRVQLGDRPLPRKELEGVLTKLQAEKIVMLAVAAP